MQRFDATTVVITGVGRRGQVGEAVARAFAAEGARLILIDRNEHEVRARARELDQDAAGVIALPGDLTDPDDAARLAREGDAFAGGRIGALVALAGGFAMSGPVAGSDPGLYDRQIAINLTTAYLTARAWLPLLRAGRGAIVFFASEAVLPGARLSGMSAYAAAKSGVVALMRSVAQEEGPHGVRANAVAPTSIRTADNLASMGRDQRYVERTTVAQTVLWLCSAAASGVTGQVLHLGPDGDPAPPAGS